MSRPLRYRPEIGRHVYGQMRAERRLPPGPPLSTEKAPLWMRLLNWIFGVNR